MITQEQKDKAKPILCNTQVVQNILAGRQTQDRRPIKPQPIGIIHEDEGDHIEWGKYQFDFDTDLIPFAKYQPGDILYARETFIMLETDDGQSVLYKADVLGSFEETYYKWKPSIHMPKRLARIFLKVTGVRVEIGDDGIWYFITDFERCEKP